MYRKIGLVAVIACGMLVSGPRQIQAADSAPATQSSIAGQYKAQKGDPAHDSFYSIMVLDLKSDGTMTLSNTMPDVAIPGKTIQNKSEGTWTQSGDTINISLEKANGKPIAADDPKKTLTMTVADGGKKLTNEHLPELQRQ
jgi:hypothetical protein